LFTFILSFQNRIHFTIILIELIDRWSERS